MIDNDAALQVLDDQIYELYSSYCEFDPAYDTYSVFQAPVSVMDSHGRFVTVNLTWGFTLEGWQGDIFNTAPNASLSLMRFCTPLVLGPGESGNYYTSGGSDLVHHPALIHSIDGEFTHDPKTGRPARLKSGGHGQANIDLMDDLGIEYHIVETCQNGVRLGNVPDHKMAWKRSGTGQAWFPKSWGTRDIVKACEYVVSLKSNANVPDGVTMWGTYRGVRVGVKRTDGRVSTVFPSLEQPSEKIRGGK